MTSLSAQLKRLETPQTLTLVESKSRASILFDPKEAAETDRQTIFDLAKRGLEELINLNPVFRQFQNTLFNASTITLERAVETAHVNETINQNIKKFLFQLSPYFLVHAAHNCLEWLIRRYDIHQYNVDDLMALILPYHETKIFVKCLQTIKLKNAKNRWYWMKDIQKPGVAMSKQALINRAANDDAFLSFISHTTYAAVKELDRRAYSLQAVFAFYSTITLGALDAANQITDAHVSNIAHTLSKGLSSIVPDFCAASMIITALLLTKIGIEDKFLKKIIEKLSKISHHELSKESIILLTIVCQTQSDSTLVVVDTFLSKMVDKSSITAALGSLYKANINVLPLCLPLIAKCLQTVDDKKKAKDNQKFVEMLLTELALNNADANAVIR